VKDIAKANEGTVTTIMWILVSVVIMFALAELPLIGCAVDPHGTRGLVVQRFQRWLSANGLIVARWVAALIGAYLTIVGIAGLA
jgi:ribosomal protein L35AE/L33A